jgi:hypothetical protein
MIQQFPVCMLEGNRDAEKAIELMFISGCNSEDEAQIEIFAFIMEADLDKYLDRQFEYEVVDTTNLRDQ